MPPSRTSANARTALLTGLLPVLLAAGLWLGGHPDELPGFLRNAFVADRQTHVVDEAIERIAHDYYRPIPVGKLSNASIAGVVSSLDDRFSHYLKPSEYREFNSPPHFAGIGVSIEPERHGTIVTRGGLLIARVFDASPASRAGLKAGELIVAVDGRRLQGLTEETAANLIRGKPGTNVKLRVQAPGAKGARKEPATRSLSITRALISEPVVASEQRTVDGKKLGIVALAAFTAGAHGEVRRAVERELRDGARGLVLDLRSNGGGLVSEAQLIASIFLQQGQTIVTTRGRTQPTQKLVALGGAIHKAIPTVVLVDQDTASAAEIVAAALQDHRRATVVGTHTFGKGVFQEEEPLSNGGALDITVGEYFTPDGRNLGGGGVKEGAGIAPEVKMGRAVDGPQGLRVALRTLAAKVK